MGIRIIDGKGRGFEAQVDSEGHLVVDALTFTEIGHTSEAHGLAFTWSSGTYDAAALDTILLIKNTATARTMFIETIWLSTDVDTRVVIHIPTTEVTPTGSAITGRNLLVGSGNVAESTAIQDETNNTQGNIIWSGEIMAAANPYEIYMRQALQIGQNESLAIDYVADVAACDVTVMGYFE